MIEVILILMNSQLSSFTNLAKISGILIGCPSAHEVLKIKLIIFSLMADLMKLVIKL